MAASVLLGGPAFAAFDPMMMVPPLALVGALLIGAVVVAFVRRWQQTNRPLGPSASDQLAEFRKLYEQGSISEEEFKRLRTVLGGELRREIDLPAHPAVPARPTEPAPPQGPSAGPSTPAAPPGEPGPPPPGTPPG
jgi:hypothetical protein